jgi:hypothetical protein
MLIREQFDPTIVYKESEAFAATCVQFKIKLPEIAIASGLPKADIERFKLGSDDLNSRQLWKIINALTPKERAFYNSMMSIQDAAESAGIKMPLLDLQKARLNPDPFRGALELTMLVFGLQSKDIYTKIGMANSNFSAWFRGTQDTTMIITLRKIRSGLTLEQRVFMDAILNALVSMESEPSSNQASARQLQIA